MKRRPFFIGAVVAIVAFAALARGGHDLWAATLITLAVSLLAVVFLAIHRELRWIFPPLPFLTLVLALFLSFWGAYNKSDASMTLKDILTSLLLFFISANLFREDHDWSFFAAGLVPVLWIQAAMSLRTPAGTLINANLEAAFLLMWVPVLLDRILTAAGQGSARTWYWLSGLVAAVIALALSRSASAWVVLVFVLAVWSRQMGVRWKLLLGLAGVIAMVLLLFKWEASASIANRLAWWKTAVHMFVANPWTGVGLGNYPSAFLAYRAPAGENTLSPHSWFFQIFGEMGLAGLAAFVVLVGVLAKIGGRFHEQSNLKKSFLLGGAAAVVYSLANVSGDYLIIRLLIPIFFIPLALPRSPAWRLRMSVVVLAAGAFVFSIPVLIAPFLASRHQVTGQIHLANLDVDKAEKSFQIASDLDAFNWQARRELARIWYDRSMFRQDAALFEKAMAMQKEAIRLNKLNGRLWWELGQYAASHGSISSDADAYFQRARDLGFISFSTS